MHLDHVFRNILHRRPVLFLDGHIGLVAPANVHEIRSLHDMVLNIGLKDVFIVAERFGSEPELCEKFRSLIPILDLIQRIGSEAGTRYENRLTRGRRNFEEGGRLVQRAGVAISIVEIDFEAGSALEAWTNVSSCCNASRRSYGGQSVSTYVSMCFVSAYHQTWLDTSHTWCRRGRLQQQKLPKAVEAKPSSWNRDLSGVDNLR
jgi:hypothetical protein